MCAAFCPGRSAQTSTDVTLKLSKKQDMRYLSLQIGLVSAVDAYLAVLGPRHANIPRDSPGGAEPRWLSMCLHARTMIHTQRAV